jgi:hypothetical protein
MKALQDGFLYNCEKIIITEFKEGNKIEISENICIFYGNEQEAIKFGLIFLNDIN